MPRGTLLTDTSLLSDPSQPGAALLSAFAEVGNPGINASFFGSVDATGADLVDKIVSVPDTLGAPIGTNSARFEGYLEVPAAGAYRFFATLANKDAEAVLRIADDAPVIVGKASDNRTELSAFVELKTGTLYHFTFEVRNLGGGSAALLVQAENIAKGKADSLTLYSQTAIDRATRGQVLIAKAFQLFQGFALSEREMRYLLTHSADFDNIDLSKWPTQSAEVQSTVVTARFEQFLRLTAYARVSAVSSRGTELAC